MVKIPGYVYLIIGAVMVGFSLITNSRTKTESMTVFIYVGLLFIAIGIAKLVFNYVTKDKEGEKTKHGQHTNHHQAHHIAQHQHVQSAMQHTQRTPQSQNPHQTALHTMTEHYPQHSQTQSIFPQVIVCKRCSARNPVQSSFCSRCGYSLR